MAKRITAFALALCMCLSAIPVSAATYEKNSSGRSFSDPWSVTSINTSVRTFKYGFNMKAIDEDYTHTYHETKEHTAYVKNTHRAQTKTKAAGTYAYCEITHASGTVYYRYSY